MDAAARDGAAEVTPPAIAPADTCRNCGAHATGHFCPNCGQETRVVLPTFPAFMREAAGRYVAMDGRLWRTLAALVGRPGHLTREYFAGRRTRDWLKIKRHGKQEFVVAGYTRGAGRRANTFGALMPLNEPAFTVPLST